MFNSMNAYITDLGQAIVIQGGDGVAKIPRFTVWQRQSDGDLHKHVDDGNDLDALKRKYGVDDFRVVRFVKK